MATEKALWTAWGKKDGEPFKKALTADAVKVVADAVSGDAARVSFGSPGYLAATATLAWWTFLPGE